MRFQEWAWRDCLAHDEAQAAWEYMSVSGIGWDNTGQKTPRAYHGSGQRHWHRFEHLCRMPFTERELSQASYILGESP